MKYSKILLSIIFVVIVHNIDASTYKELQSVFHHKGTSTGSPHDLHLSSLILYFNEDPIVNLIPSLQEHDRGSQQKEARFFFPYAKIKNKTCRAMIDALSQYDPTLYKISIEEKENPVPGLSLIVIYDSKKILFYHAHFNPMQSFSGIIFRFFNKDVLDALSAQNDSVLRVVQAKKPRIIVDCGHGGCDHGATVKGVMEKKITLEVGSYLAELLKKKGCQVLLTRNKDVFVPLDMRTTIANTKNADLFVSLHANYASRSQASGVETYQAPHHLINHRTMSWCNSNSVWNTLINKQEKVRIAANNTLAHVLQEYTCQAAHHMFQDVVSRGVKQKPLQVLMGTTMPAALVELGFLSHAMERNFLKQKAYQKLLAHGMCNAITNYFQRITT